MQPRRSRRPLSRFKALPPVPSNETEKLSPPEELPKALVRMCSAEDAEDEHIATMEYDEYDGPLLGIWPTKR